MTSTISSGTLTVTHTEALTLADSAGTDRVTDTTNTFTIANVLRTTRQHVTISTTETGLMSFAANLTSPPAAVVAATYVAGHYDQASVRYLRIANKDGTNFVILRFRGTDLAEFAVKLDAGQSYVYGCDNAGGTVLTMDADTQATTVVLQDLEDITADADTADVDLETYVALV